MRLTLLSGLITHKQEAGRGKQIDLPIVKSTEEQGKVVWHRHEDLEGFQNSKKNRCENRKRDLVRLIE